MKMGDVLGKDAPVEAAEIGAESSREAATAQRQSAKEALSFARDILGSELERDVYGRAFAERGFDVGLEQYRDQHALQQAQFGTQQSQLGYGNQIRQQALGNLQQFANVGLGALPRLASMTSGSGIGLSGPVSLSQAAQSFSPPQLQASLPQSAAPGYIGSTIEKIQRPVQQQLPSLLEIAGQGAEEVQQQESEEDLYKFVRPLTVDNIKETEQAVGVLVSEGVSLDEIREDPELFELVNSYVRGKVPLSDFVASIRSKRGT